MPEDIHNYNSISKSNASDGEIQGDFDPYKLLIVFKKTIPAMILILLLAIISVVFFLRYSKPVYQSTAVFKLQPDKTSSSLGFAAIKGSEDEASDLSGEIEIISSPVVRDKVCSYLNLQVSYFVYGNILFEEKFGNSPIRIEYTEEEQIRHDKPIDIQILDDDKFQIEIKEADYSAEFNFGQTCVTPYGTFKIVKTLFFKDFDKDGKMFMTFNSPAMLNRYFQENLSADISNIGARTISISFKDHNAIKAYHIVKSIDSIYLDQTLQMKLKSFDQAIAFLNTSIDKAENNLLNAENEFESFMRRSKTMDVRADYSRYSTQEAEIQLQRTELKLHESLLNDLNDIVVKDESLEDFIPSLPKLEDVQLAKAISSLNQLNQEKSKMALSQSPNTHAYKAKQAAEQKMKDGVLGLIDQNKKIIQKQIHELNRQNYEIEGTKLTLPAKETEMSRLKRHYNLYDKFYVMLMEKMVEQSIAKAAITNNFVEISRPYPDDNAIYPKKQILFTFGIALGVLFCVCLIIIRYLLYDTITTQKELEKSIEVPIIGSVPVYNKEIMMFSQLVVHKNPKSAVSESIRSIRTNLEFIVPGKKKKILSITSTISGEGKTFVAVNLGGIIAMSNQKVIVLDLDMRKPKVHLAFGAENNRGMSTILIGKDSIEDCVQKTDIPNLDFIAAGPLPPNPSELILLKEFDNLIEELHSLYDVVIIDTPPVGLVTDGILIMKKADVPLYVVRINHSKFAVAKEIRKTLSRGDYKKLCVVANGVPISNSYGYGYYDNETPEKKKTWYNKLF